MSAVFAVLAWLWSTLAETAAYAFTHPLVVAVLFAPVFAAWIVGPRSRAGIDH